MLIYSDVQVRYGFRAVWKSTPEVFIRRPKFLFLIGDAQKQRYTMTCNDIDIHHVVALIWKFLGVGCYRMLQVWILIARYTWYHCISSLKASDIPPKLYPGRGQHMFPSACYAQGGAEFVERPWVAIVWCCFWQRSKRIQGTEEKFDQELWVDVCRIWQMCRLIPWVRLRYPYNGTSCFRVSASNYVLQWNICTRALWPIRLHRKQCTFPSLSILILVSRCFSRGRTIQASPLGPGSTQ